MVVIFSCGSPCLPAGVSFPPVGLGQKIDKNIVVKFGFVIIIFTSSLTQKRPMSRLKTTLSLGVLSLLAVFAFAVPVNGKEDDHLNSVKASNIYLQGTLTAMSGNTLPATLTMTSGATSYIVNVPANANIDRKYNGESNLGEFILGDTIQVWGKLSDSVTNTIDVTRVRDISIQRAGGTFKGTIVALDCANNKFTFKPEERSQQTVNLSTTTKIIRGGQKIACKDLVAKEKTKVIGLWRKTSNRIDADRIIVNMRSISGTIASIDLTNGGLPAVLTLEVKNKKTWTIGITSKTKLFRKYLGTATIEEILVGDKVEAHGIVSEGNSLEALVLRDTSVSVKFDDFEGKVKSIDATASSFVLRINSKKYGDVTVTTSSTTKFLQESTEETFADIAVGDKLKVLGTYTKSTKSIAATRIFWED